jgi:lipopolysaccharide/colanic/teichoic acid biosynthesis glycosyltransferase
MQIATGDHGDAPSAAIPPWKRALDLAGIILTLPVTLPLALAVGVFIRLTAGAPVIFRQERVGLNGRRFTCLKFRTMAVNADTSGHREYLQQLARQDIPMTKLDLKGDNRLIFGARFLRATGLDELPQLVNVWRGEMSLVGPRPCLPYEYDNYNEQQKERLSALPGLTGLWQVSGKNNTTFNEMIRLDVWYARNLSLWLDVKIILRTIPALVIQALEARCQNRPATGACSAVTDGFLIHKPSEKQP